MTKDEAQSRRGGTDGLFTKPLNNMLALTKTGEEVRLGAKLSRA
jgi:hypothetical protein